MPLARRSSIAVLAASVALAACFAALGRWQWERADEARRLHASFAAGGELPPLERVPRDADAGGLRYREAEIDGHYEPRLQFLLDNRVHAGRVGYEVLTPFRAAGVSRLLLVNRGWVPAGADRGTLPDVRVDAQERRVRGRIDKLPRPGLVLAPPVPDRPIAGVAVVSYPTAAQIAAALGGATFDYQLLLDPGAADGYVRDWRVAGPAPERNMAYAGQWFLLAATTVVIGGGLAWRLQRGARTP